MKYAFLLSGENIDMAAAEALAVTQSKKHAIDSNLLVIERKKSGKSAEEFFVNEMKVRLALSKSVSRIIFSCRENELKKKIEKYDWNSVCNGSFCARSSALISCGKPRHTSKELGSIIWRNLKSPSVNLENPDTELIFFFSSNEVYCCLLLADINYCYDKRKFNKKPFRHPSTLHPRIARAVVNLAVKNNKKKITDPFCGSGSLLAEAGIMGMDIEGWDIEKDMIEGCKRNLEYFGIKKYNLRVADAMSIRNAEYIAADLPYGLNSKAQSAGEKISMKQASNKPRLEKFYLRFLKRIKRIKIKRAAIIFPDFVDYKKIVSDSGLKTKNIFSVYIHKSLTRKIVILE